MTKTTATPERTAGDPGERARERLLADLPLTQRRLELAGVSTCVLEGGQGTPIVLLHGPGGNATHWGAVAAALTKSNRVIVPDLPGQGSSRLSAAPPTAESVKAWLRELIKATCPSPPALVGYALGGAIAARFACAEGERMSALVLVDALGLADFEPAPEFGRALQAFLGDPSEATHDELWHHCARDLEGLRMRMGEKWASFQALNVDRAQAPTTQAALEALMGEFAMRAIPANELARITVPTTLIWGRDDLATPLSVAEAAAARHGWSLEVIESCADDPPVEQPEAFVTSLRAALGSGTSAWDRIAGGYDRTNTPSQMWLGNEGLKRAGLRPGMRFLDVAAGSGALAIPAARSGGRVLATDLSPAMLELLGERARAEGVQVETAVMDGEALELDDESFDVAGSQFGVMLFEDMPCGISEMARVVKPGGRVLVSAYGDPGEIEFLHFFVAAVQAVVPDFDGPPMDPVPLPFQLQDPERLRAELVAAGLSEVEVETVSEETSFRSGAHLWDWLVHSNPIVGAILAELDLSAEQTTVVEAALDEQVRERSTVNGVATLVAPVNIGTATK